MTIEHEHDWILVTNFGDTRLMRFCKRCPERQMLSPDDWHKELEQQLAQAQKENERLRERDAEWTESNAKAVTRYAEARALLERYNNFLSLFQLPEFQPLLEDYRAFLGK